MIEYVTIVAQTATGMATLAVAIFLATIEANIVVSFSTLDI